MTVDRADEGKVKVKSYSKGFLLNQTFHSWPGVCLLVLFYLSVFTVGMLVVALNWLGDGDMPVGLERWSPVGSRQVDKWVEKLSQVTIGSNNTALVTSQSSLEVRSGFKGDQSYCFGLSNFLSKSCVILTHLMLGKNYVLNPKSLGD